MRALGSYSDLTGKRLLSAHLKEQNMMAIYVLTEEEMRWLKVPVTSLEF